MVIITTAEKAQAMISPLLTKYNVQKIKIIIFPSFANKAKLAEKTKRQAINIMQKVTENEISAGKDPYGISSNCSLYNMYKNR